MIYLGSLIIALVIVWLALKASRIYTAYRAATQHLTALEATALAGPIEGDLAQAEASLHGLATSLDILNEELRPFLPLTPYLGWVPVYGGDLRALPYLVIAGRDLSQSALVLTETISPVLSSESEVAEVGPLPYLVASLASANTDFEREEALLRQHRAVISEIDIKRLSSPVAYRVAQLDQYLAQAIDGLQAARQLPVLFGADGPRTYLILMQNSDELRPSGGYINAAGHIILDHGRIAEFVMQDSYAVDRLSEDYPYPPDPLYQYMGAEYWVLRDVGWSPDFSATASMAIRLYELGQGVSADGVIAIDQQALTYILRAFDSVRVDTEYVTSDNVVRLMRHHWAPEVGQQLDSEWWLRRKSFMVELAETIRNTVEQGATHIDLPTLASALQQALDEKHILIYGGEPSIADFLANQHWSGALQAVQSDYLMAVDANVGFNKANAMVERQITYRVTVAEDGSAYAHATLAYQHRAQNRIEPCSTKLGYAPIYEQNTTRCYWNYLRLVVPSEANLLRGPQIVVEGEYLLRGRPTTGEIDTEPLGSDKVSWGQLFLLAPGESLSLDYVYTLPPGTARKVGNEWAYKLYLQKQPGTHKPTVEVVVNLPEMAQLLESRPLPFDQQGTISTYSVSLDTDQEIEILYRLP